jgi:hypothetical protein
VIPFSRPGQPTIGQIFHYKPFRPAIVLVVALSFGLPDLKAQTEKTLAPVEIERVPVAGGAELLTVFRVTGLGRTPIAAALRDTLGDTDAANDRLRHVWLLTHQRPSFWRHFLAAVPFLYLRIPAELPPADRRPRPLLDMAKPVDNTVRGFTQVVLQAQTFDPLGTMVRSSTRAYRRNLSDLRHLRLSEAVAVLDDLPLPSEGAPGADVRQLRARLGLSSQMLGGLVPDKNLGLFFEKERVRLEEMRGRNWELLRQAAEVNGLVFEPLRLAGGPPSHALLWVSRSDLTGAAPRRYDRRFVRVKNPWQDPRVRHWRSYTGTGIVDGREAELIPLALFSLDHPKTPLLLIDFRDRLAVTRREFTRRAAADATIGLFGLTKFAAWEWFAAVTAWEFATGRQGMANNRAWRLRSYAELEQKIALDQSLPARLRGELQNRLGPLAASPLETQGRHLHDVARIQYAALLTWARDPKAMGPFLQRARAEELAMENRRGRGKASLVLARALTFGAYRPRAQSPTLLAQLDRARRIDYHRRYLELALTHAPQPEVLYPIALLRESIAELARLEPRDPAVRQLLARFQQATGDEQARAQCADALRESTHSGMQE